MAGHHHHHHPGAEVEDKRVLWAVGVNLLLTIAQVVGGILSGSLSLVADAIHNLSDAITLGIAFFARRIARRPSDETMTFGYVRAEIVAALINYTTLIVIGLYLVYEAIMRFIEPQEIAGWIVVILAGIALVVDAATVLLTYAMSKSSMNIRAAFIHNVADALASVGVIIAGTLIILYDWRIVDPIVTILIAGYILWHGFAEIGGSIRMLMLGTPKDVDAKELVEALRCVEGVKDVHHVHLWAIDEAHNALEAHVVIEDEIGGQGVKERIKSMMREHFSIGHTTLELEASSATCEDAKTIGHRVAAAHHEHEHHRYNQGADSHV